MKCRVDNCNREDTKRRFKMGYCDGHYQRIYLNDDLNERSPVKEYAKRGAGVEFLKRISKTDTSGCINWKYGKDSKGYGQVFYKGKRIKAHRLARMFYEDVEELPKDVFACHKCDNSLCVNPLHVYFGDAKTNVDDKYLYRT